MEEYRLITDNVQGHIKVSRLAEKIINTSVFKRLKSIKQLQAVHEVFPTGNHTRFEHSLGVMHLARSLCEALGASREDTRMVEIAGLCHDLGHGPYSHLWESFVRHQRPNIEWEHEESSFKMLLLAMEENPEIKMSKEELDFVRELICGGDQEREKNGEYPYSARGPEKFFLYEIIANKVTGIDVDKMDYIRRDAKALGLKTKFNFLRFVEAGEPRLVEVPYSASGPMVKRIAVREKVVKTIQDLFLDRTDLHATAYHHKTAIMFNLMYMDVWVLADPYIKVAGRDGGLLCLSEACMDEVALARLTEGWLHQTIRNSTDPGLAAARALLLRIDQRKMYRVVARIQGANLTQAVSFYEQELRTSSGLECGVTSCGQAEQLEGRDLAVTKISINMGKTTNDALGRLNPVEKMLFYRKGNLEGYEMEKDELMLFAPQRIHMEQLYVVLKKEGPEAAAAAKAAVQKWVEGKEWKVVIA